jgi:hypothetical protein
MALGRRGVAGTRIVVLALAPPAHAASTSDTVDAPVTLTAAALVRS